jgi:DNA-3-methyladenine glycosylase
MFGPPGLAYVYLVYGMYDCLNIVTEPEGRPAALLVRAVEPIDGIDQIRTARVEWVRSHRRTADLTRLPAARLASGPGLVGAAFSIDRLQNGVDLCDPSSDVRLEAAPAGDVLPVETGARVGIGYAEEPWLSKPWRFYVPGNPAVSRRVALPRQVVR